MLHVCCLHQHGRGGIERIRVLYNSRAHACCFLKNALMSIMRVGSFLRSGPFSVSAPLQPRVEKLALYQLLGYDI